MTIIFYLDYFIIIFFDWIGLTYLKVTADFENTGYYIFLQANYTMGHFEGTKTFLTP
jgi:hypothetical protein